MRSPWVVLVLLILGGDFGGYGRGGGREGGRGGVGVEGKRPELVGSSIWDINSTVVNIPFEGVMIQMDFDQPLYTNGHSFLCPESDIPCPPLSCKACDWSGQQPTGCDDPDCCGPAQNGEMERAEKWCDASVPPYETLTIGETSKRFTMEKGENMYIRFFIPEEYYCRTIIVIPRPYYGTVSSSYSTLDAVPSSSTDSGWRNALTEKAVGYGQSSVLMCPNTTIHPEYNVGTYSGMLYALAATSFEIEIVVSEQEYPLPEPPVRLSCDDVPQDVWDYASRFEPAYCVEDGKSQTFNFSFVDKRIQQLALVIPVPKGCHTLSFSSAFEIPANPYMTHHMACNLPNADLFLEYTNAGLFRIATSGQTFVLTQCFEEEVTYLFCSLRLLSEGEVHFSWSSESEVVRKSMMELPDASLAYMDGLQQVSSMVFGEGKFPCVDFFGTCSDWTLPPSDNALPLFPPFAFAESGIEQVFEDMQEFYRSLDLQEKKENRLTFVSFSKIGAIATFTDDAEFSVVINSVTNKDGEVVNLPGGGIDNNSPASQPYSMSNWIVNMPHSAIPKFELPSCDFDKYAIYQEVVAERTQKIVQKSTLDETLDIQYSLNVLGESVLTQSCNTQVSDNLPKLNSEIIIRDSIDCFRDFGTLEWILDVCCNQFLRFVDCCLPRDYNLTGQIYGTPADVSQCGEPECAESYYEDLSFSLNNLDDIFLGCTSGISDPSPSLAIAVVEAMQSQYINCLNEVGFGELYQGTSCQIDEDCSHLEGICVNKVCVLPNLEEVESQFLMCYIAKMPSYLESFLKRNILPSNIGDFSRNSTEFYEALKEAATEKDCVNPLNPLEIDHRTRYQSRPSDYACIAKLNGLEWPQQSQEAYDACPGEPCLRSFGCLINTTSCIKSCIDYEQDLIPTTEEDCPLQEECDIDVDGDCEGSYCVYCPENGDLPCHKADNFDNENDCNEGVACELLDGSVVFTLTEEECWNYGEGCTVDCVGNSCESVYKLSGACFVPSLTSSDCILFGDNNNVETQWFKDTLCVLPDISKNECEQLMMAEWETCQENSLEDCTGSTTQQQFLGCYESLWHQCANQEECEGSGECTDREYYAIVHSHDPVRVQYGGCIGSGVYVTDTEPECGEVQASLSKLGCNYFLDETEEACDARVPPTPFFFLAWVELALTKEQCLSIETGRGGCQLYQDPVDVLIWIFDDDECQCHGGVIQNAWEWIPGVWKGGVPRSLEWKKAEKKSSYSYQDALSFILLADWIRESAEEQFLFPLQSQIICESYSITNPVNVLVCDCLAGGGEECYRPGESEKEILMGFSEICEGRSTFVKDPSAQVSFGTQSISEGCTFVNISLINRNWFAAPFVPSPLSFKWQDQREGGVVLNDNGATVGDVLGDGVVLSFSQPNVVGVFDVCLRLNTNPSKEYKKLDFGYSNDELKFIYPLGLSNLRTQEDAGDWYCSAVDFQDVPTDRDGTIRIFPIRRLENYEEEENEYTSDTTRGLCYTLGALYCFIGFLSLVGLLIFLKQSFSHNKNILSLPNFCTFTFLVLCIFRAVFMFLYPEGTFEDQPLAYFVIFEIPTFLLFSTLIFMIYSFKRLVYKKGFFPGNPTPILYIGWPLVWALWVIVTIVYSEVILDGSSGSSPCEGRVEVSYDEEEEDTRKLAIAYQTVIIFITLVLTVVFFYYTFIMYGTANKKKNKIKQFVIVVGGSFNVAFLLRTILFLIILIADFASSVYLFCTLFLTEILMMSFILIQFNLRHIEALANALSDSTTGSGSFMGGSRGGSAYSGRSSGGAASNNVAD